MEKMNATELINRLLRARGETITVKLCEDHFFPFLRNGDCVTLQTACSTGVRIPKLVKARESVFAAAVHRAPDRLQLFDLASLAFVSYTDRQARENGVKVLADIVKINDQPL